MHDHHDHPRETSLHRRHLLRGLATAGAVSTLGYLAPASISPHRARPSSMAASASPSSSGASTRPANAGTWNGPARRRRSSAALPSRSCRPRTGACSASTSSICAIAPNGMPGAPFMRGFNNPRYHEEVIATHPQGDRRLCRAGLPQRHRLHRLQMARRRQSQERRNQPARMAPTTA